MTPEDKALCRAIEARGEAILATITEAELAKRDDTRQFRAVNWADLGVVEVARCEAVHDDEVEYRVLVEEASPDCGLDGYLAQLLTKQFGVRVAVQTEW